MSENESDFNPEMDDDQAVTLSESEISRVIHSMDDDEFAAFLEARGYNFDVPRELATGTWRSDKKFGTAKEMRGYLIKRILPPVV
jgi:hypothetical protein